MTAPHIPINAVDLFSGAGGLTHGLAKAGINVRVGVDVDPACEYPYTENNKAKFLLKSVGDIESRELASYYLPRSVRLLAGCAPCQTFSSYNQKASTDDDRWWLLRHFSRLAGELLPELVTMENVPGLLNHAVFDEFVGSLEASGYEVSKQIVDCQDYGVPQHRNRLVLLASRLGPISLLTPAQFNAKPTSVREAIGNGRVPALAAGSADAVDRLHRASRLSPLNLRRIKASKPGGTWRDWPDELVAECHKKESGKTYAGVYGRMTWDEAAPTMTTQFYGFGNGRFGHPSQDRAISLREGAILQGFPLNYQFVAPGAPVHMKTIGRLIGNAVPVTLGELIGRSMKAHVKEHRDDVLRVLTGGQLA
ncbi:putative BsuMI modification methylase subunit YdiO [Corynebacterium occultum]|uniref:DNA (cytosine-5-)-methyltransferase n=1 Tax=Corynebacterium occultum TaxID=2675219 RepID=A0A6B8W9S6_9CORY|nr:DNA cytosine methyltransferase [Corynebacterium occultum]QGU06750.1 putative BsuMI modification methylase subunit YdiO [Corynebacterium occultum]